MSRICWDVIVQLLALRQHLIQFVLADNGTQRCLRQFARCLVEILDLDDRFFRIDNTEVDDGVDFYGNVVARNHILRWHIENAGAKIDALDLLD